MRRLSLALMFVVALARPVRADVNGDAVERFVRLQMVAYHIPGCSVAVLKDGQSLLTKGYGLANMELSTPTTPDTVFEILSITKQFTTTAALMLVDDGKIQLDASITQYLPDLPQGWSAAKVENLLSNTSGVPDYTEATGFWQHIRDDSTPAELITPLKTRPLLFDPGTVSRNSNTNFYLLGMIIEKVTGKSLNDVLTERIFQPLGMNATRLNDTTEIIPNRAAGYHWLGEETNRLPVFVTGFHGKRDVLQNAVYISPTKKWAAGSAVSTVNDLTRWDQALLAGKLLKPETAQRAVQPYKLKSGEAANYGFGNELSEVQGHHVVGHVGAGIAFNCTLYRMIDDHLTVIVLCNQTTAPSKTVAEHIASIYLPNLAEQLPAVVEDPEPAVSEVVKKVLADAAGGKSDADYFASPAMAEFIQNTGSQLMGNLGQLQFVTLVERRMEKANRLYIYRASFERQNMVWTVILNPQGKIVRMEPGTS